MASKKELIKKWESAEGKMSIKGVDDPYLKENLAQLLENQERKDFNGEDVFMTEASDGVTNIGQLGDDGISNGLSNSDAYKFRPVALALVRRTFPDLFANKIVGVQAMSTPVGLAYALRVVYNDGSLTEASWDKVPEYAGYSGSSRGSSAELTEDGDTEETGADTDEAESWQIAGTGGSPEWPQLKLKIDQKAIEAVTRKLAASFSLEAAQDIRAMHGIDVEREMVNILQYEITAELDREILANVKNAAVDTDNGGEVVSAIDLTGDGTGIDGRWAGEKYMNIIASIVYFANKIAYTTRRAPGNFVVVSPAIASALQSAGHQFVAHTQNVNPATTMASIGKLNGTLEVYRDQYADTDYALVGYKGSSISDAGVLFCPYIMGLTNRAVSQDDFAPRVGVMSRYSIVTSLLGAGRYYRMVPFTNVNKLIAGAN